MKRGLKPDEVKKVSSPKLVYESRAGKPKDVELLAAATADGTYDATEQAMLQDVYDKMNELLAALKES